MREVSPGRVAAAITAYLARHPDAADSAEGIARWWLPGEGIDVSPEEVRCALAQLIDRHVVAVRRLPDGRRIYSAARRGESGQAR